MRLLSSLVILALCLSAYPALAAKRLTVDDIRDMAIDKGIVSIKEIELDDGVWQRAQDQDRGGRGKRRDREDQAQEPGLGARPAPEVYPHPHKAWPSSFFFAGRRLI